MTWFGGIYQDPRNFFVQFAVDVESSSGSTRSWG